MKKVRMNKAEEIEYFKELTNDKVNKLIVDNIGLVHTICNRRQLNEDYRQEGALLLREAIYKYDPHKTKGKLGSYLYSFVNLRMLNLLRHSKTKKKCILCSGNDILYGEGDVIKDNYTLLLYTILSEVLPELNYKIIELRVMKQYFWYEIADELNIPIKRIRKEYDIGIDMIRNKFKCEEEIWL